MKPKPSPPKLEADEVVKRLIHEESLAIEGSDGPLLTEAADCIRALQGELASVRANKEKWRRRWMGIAATFASVRERTIEECVKAITLASYGMHEVEYEGWLPAMNCAVDAIRALAKPTEKEKGE